jgi:hypothetical protein
VVKLQLPGLGALECKLHGGLELRLLVWVCSHIFSKGGSLISLELPQGQGDTIPLAVGPGNADFDHLVDWKNWGDVGDTPFAELRDVNESICRDCGILLASIIEDFAKGAEISDADNFCTDVGFRSEGETLPFLCGC